MRGISQPLCAELEQTDPTFLAEHRLTVVADRYDRIAFGSSLVELENSELHLRLVRDRGQTWADAGAIGSPGRWSSLCTVRELMGLPLLEPTLTNWTQFIRAHYREPVELFGAARHMETEQRVQARDRQRTFASTKP